MDRLRGRTTPAARYTNARCYRRLGVKTLSPSPPLPGPLHPPPFPPSPSPIPSIFPRHPSLPSFPSPCLSSLPFPRHLPPSLPLSSLPLPSHSLLPIPPFSYSPPSLFLPSTLPPFPLTPPPPLPTRARGKKVNGFGSVCHGGLRRITEIYQIVILSAVSRGKNWEI